MLERAAAVRACRYFSPVRGGSTPRAQALGWGCGAKGVSPGGAKESYRQTLTPFRGYRFITEGHSQGLEAVKQSSKPYN